MAIVRSVFEAAKIRVDVDENDDWKQSRNSLEEIITAPPAKLSLAGGFRTNSFIGFGHGDFESVFKDWIVSHPDVGFSFRPRRFGLGFWFFQDLVFLFFGLDIGSKQASKIVVSSLR